MTSIDSINCDLDFELDGKNFGNLELSGGARVRRRRHLSLVAAEMEREDVLAIS